MDLKSLYTNVPVLEAIKIAADKVYDLEETPPMDKSTFMQLMRLRAQLKAGETCLIFLILIILKLF